MKSIIFQFPLLLSLLCSSVTRADWNPIVLNAIKWTSNNQDIQSIRYTQNEGILRLPMKYYGGIDTNVDGIISEKEITNFNEWVQQHIPEDYCGPIALDYEKPWWKELRAETISQERLNELITVYVKGLRIAKSTRPKAQWGYFGLPARRNTTNKWLERGLSLEPIISSSNALYPSIYNCKPGIDITRSVEEHVSKILEEAAGQIPVYVFVSPRYCGQGDDKSMFIPDDVFLHHTNAAMRASWTDADGIPHRIRGLVLWDGYEYTNAEEWGELDLRHERYFKLLHALVNAWKKAMTGKLVIDAPMILATCEGGLPEPQNSGDDFNVRGTRMTIINQLNDDRVRDDRLGNERIPAGRIPTGRKD